MAIGPPTLGPKPPLVIRPTARPVATSRTSAPSRAGARPSGLRPTSLRGGPPGPSWGTITSAPGKSRASRRRLGTVQPSTASAGVVVASMSWP
jgi:hypothetical protein